MSKLCSPAMPVPIRQSDLAVGELSIQEGIPGAFAGSDRISLLPIVESDRDLNLVAHKHKHLLMIRSDHPIAT